MSIETAVQALSTAAEPNVKVEEIKSFGHTQEPKVVETPVETKPDVTPPVEAPKKDEAQERFNKLAMRERILNRDRQEMKLLAQQVQEQMAKVQEFETARKAALTNPLDALKQLGLSYDQVTEFMLNNKRPTAEHQVQELKSQLTSELEALRTQVAEEKKAALEAAKQREVMEYQQTLQEYDVEVQDFVKANAEKYELVAQFNEVNLVKALVQENLKTQKKLLSLDEAAQLAENYLETLANKALATKKYKAKVEPQPKGDIKQGTSAQSRTLTNEMTTSSAPSFIGAKTEADRLARAMAALDRK